MKQQMSCAVHCDQVQSQQHHIEGHQSGWQEYHHQYASHNYSRMSCRLSPPAGSSSSRLTGYWLHFQLSSLHNNDTHIHSLYKGFNCFHSVTYTELSNDFEIIFIPIKPAALLHRC